VSFHGKRHASILCQPPSLDLTFGKYTQSCTSCQALAAPHHGRRRSRISGLQQFARKSRRSTASGTHGRLTQAGQRCTGALATTVWYLLGALRFSLGGSGREVDWAKLPLDPLLLQLPAPAPMCGLPCQPPTPDALLLEG
jgi:hypothetical protein